MKDIQVATPMSRRKIPNFPSKEFRSLNKEDRDLLAQHLRNPPVSVGDIARLLGLSVRAGDLGNGASGEIRPAPGGQGYLIRVNKSDHKNRQRFTVAHEIAHFLLHRDQIGDGVTDDFLYRSGLPEPIEAEANRLAADILMPVDLIQSMLESEEFSDIPIDQCVEPFAQIFGVSPSAMRIRLGVAG